MFESESSEFLTSPINQTKTKLSTAISSAKGCIVPHQTKLNESNILLNDASQIQCAANAFEERLFNFNELRSTKVIDQLSETNTQLEDTLSLFTDFSNALVSTKSSAVKTLITVLSPMLPSIIFSIYENFQQPSNDIEETDFEEEDVEERLNEDQLMDYYQSMCGMSC